MRWVLAAFVVAWSAVASAQTMTVPAGFTAHGGGDVYTALARKGDSIAVHVYGDRQAELATVSWQWHSAGPTRTGIASFERDLARRARHDGAREVSNTLVFDRDPMLAEVFDMLGRQRIYHRRLYAVDAKGIVHLWWTVCTAPATAIVECEQAQRTMKLDVARAITLPAEAPPPPKPSAGTFKAPEPIVDPDRPGLIDVPAGYRELQSPALDDVETKLRVLPGVEEVASRLFVSPDRAVSLLQLTVRMTADGGPLRELARGIDSGLTNGVSAPRVVDNELVSELRDEHLERRTLYAADTNDKVFTFSVACIGPAPARAECVRALATMRLRVPDQLAVTDPAWDVDHHRSPLGQLLIVMFVAVVPLTVILWIAKNRRKSRRRVRPPTMAAVD